MAYNPGDLDWRGPASGSGMQPQRFPEETEKEN